MAISEVDVWHDGTDDELAALVASAPGTALEGHDLVCRHAVIEEESPIAQALPPKRTVNGLTVQDPAPPPRPGRKRARLNYGPRVER